VALEWDKGGDSPKRVPDPDGRETIYGPWRFVRLPQFGPGIISAEWFFSEVNTTFQDSDSTDPTLNSRVTGDAFSRWRVLASGKHEWGSGSASHDTNLYRQAANVLKTDDRLVIGTPDSAPTDADLGAASISFYLDEAGNELQVRVKYADGTTLKTGAIALT
jgi:hypothetical protein